MTSIEQNLHNRKPYDGHDSITTTNGHRLQISGIGTISTETLTLDNSMISTEKQNTKQD